MTKTNWMEKALAIFAAACAMVACLAIAEAPAFAAQDNVAEAQQGAAASAAGTSVEPAEGTAVAPAATVAAPAPISAAAQVGANQPRGGAQDATGVSGASQPAATVEEKPAAADGQATAQAADATAATPAASGAGSQQSAEQGSAKADKSPEAGAAAKATEAAAGADKKDGAATASSDAKAGASKASSQEEASKNKRVDAQSKDAASGAAAKDREAKDNAAATADASKDAASKSDAAKDAATKEVSNSSDAASKSSAQASAAKDDNKAAATNDAAASKDATAAVASTQALTVSSQSASSSQDVTGWLRLYGQTALDTMAKVVQTGFDTSEAAVLATNSTYLDALSASPLAGMLKAPILLTDKSALSPQTASELARMKTKKVYIVGGRMAVSLNVGEQLLARGLQVERIAGANAAGTAEEVARKIGSAAGDTCIVATSSSFADALSIAPYAYSHVAPIFLSDKKKGLAGTTTSLIKQSDFDHAVIVGGELAVPKNVESQVSSAGVQDVVRLAGANAYKTNAEVASWCLKQGMRRERMTVATAKNYQDALSGAALSGKNNSILLLADDGDRSSISRHFRPYVSLVKRGYILGGPLAVSSITREYLLQPAGSTTLISSARTIADGLYSLLPAANTAFTVEVANGLLSKDAAVSLFAKNNTFAQKWQIVWTGRGYYIRNLGSGLVLGTKGNSTAPGASVVQRGYSNVDDVLWSIAKTASGSVTIRSLKSGMALDITRAAYANGTTINIRTPNGTAAQRFAVRSTESLVDGAVYSIFLAANGRVMDVPGGTGTYATQMQLYDYNGSPAQKFVARRVEAGVYALQSLASGLYLQDYNGGNVVQGPKVANAKSQQWFVRPGLFGAMLANKATDRVLTTWGDNTGNGARLVTRAVQSKLNQQYRIGFVAPIDNGIYTIYNMKGGRALSVVDPVFSNGSNITTWARDDGAEQAFQVTMVENGYYRITTILANKAVEVTGSSNANGANVQQYAQNGTDAQLWKVQITENGTYVFVNKASGKVLDVVGGGNYNGANVQQYESNGTTAQQWRLARNSNTFNEALTRAGTSNVYTSSSTNYLICVDLTNHQVMVFTGGSGRWRPTMTTICSVGKDSTPTVTGDFTVGSRGYSFGHGYTCYYWTQITGDYLFHSTKYREGTFEHSDPRLGMNISMGCVRMPIEKAKWIYDRVPSGTRIRIYR